MAKNFMLRDERTGSVLSRHPNTDGAKLSALFHVENGEAVKWDNGDVGPVSVAAARGYVGEEHRFTVYLY